ncbi:MAG: hypothetical protein MRJ93_05265 [Nitrososphaeraceae archaeon]|nr:hypothetical protein [Nitrososphaeraceae archaeon]
MNISRTIPIFLIATILMFGTTISMGIPASFAEPQYNYDKNQPYNSYGKDYDKKKSSEVNLQKVKCNNIIINGVDSAAGQGAGEDMLNGLANDNYGTGQQDSQWLGNEENKRNDINENIVNFCKNKHNKVVVTTEAGPQTNPPPQTDFPCPPGTDFTVTDGVGICVGPNTPSAAECPNGFTLNTDTGECTQDPVNSCEDGYTFNTNTQQCEQADPATCPDGFTLNTDTGECTMASVNACPNVPGLGSTTFSPPNNCTRNANNAAQATACTNAGGTLAPGTTFPRLCTIPVPPCPTGSTLNTSTGQCEFTPVNACPDGTTYDPSTQQCITSQDPSCPTGSTLNTSTGQCEFTPVNACPDGTTYDPSTQQCITPLLQCPQGFNPVLIPQTNIIAQCDQIILGP